MTSNSVPSSNPTIIGISHQPYRSYLTDRNHFYHSASVANPAGQVSSASGSPPNSAGTTTNSLHYPSHIQSQQASSLQSSPAKSAVSSGTTTNQLTNSRTSLNSNSSNHQHQHNHQQNSRMMKQQQQNKRSSTTSSTLPIGTKSPTTTDDDDEYLYPQVGACTRCLFGLLWVVAQIGLFGSVGLLVWWMFHFDKGFAFQNDKRKQFNLHAFLMLTGFIFVNGQSMLIYKTYMCCKKIYNKIAHAIFFVLSISLVSFGMLVAIQAQHAVPPEQTPVHFYSLHSWIGLVTCGLFALQFFFGFVTFLVLLCCERATAGYRARFLPIHVTFGLVIFLLACATCLSGLLQTARSRLSGPTPTDPTKPDYKDVFVIRDYNPFTNASLVLNAVGGCLILLGAVMPYLVRNFNFNHRYDAASFRVNH